MTAEAGAPAPPRVGVLTVSSSRARSGGSDEGGDALAELVDRLGGELVARELVADDRDEIAAVLRRFADELRCDLALTTGGTGLTADDVTPEATAAAIDRPVPGIAEAMRAASADHTPYWMLSRATAGVRARTLIVNFPGSPKAIVEVGDVLAPVVDHAVALLRRGDGVVGLVLAGGAGLRFGGGKQLADLEGRPLVQHAVDAAAAATGLDRLVVVLGADAERVRAALHPGRADVVTCPGWEEGIAASLRRGFEVAGGAAWVVVLLGDEPRLPVAAIARIVDAARVAPTDVAAVRARWGGGRLGHPVAMRGALSGRVAHLRGDRGARELLADLRTVEIDCADLGDPADVDVPADLDSLRGASPER